MAADEMKITLSVVSADVGGFIGHVSCHPEVLDTAKERLHLARDKGIIIDFLVLRCGDDLELIVTHQNGPEDRETHEFLWNTLLACREAASELKLHATTGGLSREPFTGSLRCMGPGISEIEFEERVSEPVVIVMANKACSGSWNLPLYRIFADPSNTPGLFQDPNMFEGYTFTVLDLKDIREIELCAPKEIHSLLALVTSTSRYVITSVRRTSDGDVAAVVSAQKYDYIGGVVAKHAEPSVIFRCQSGFPAVGEVMEAFSFPHLVNGWLRNSHIGPLMPVPFYEANPTRFDGPPRAIAAGFQIADGRLIGPHDMFDDPSFDETRRLASQITDYLRRHGSFQPHRLIESEMEYSSIHIVREKLKDRFKKLT